MFDERLQKIRITFLFEHPFLSVLALSLSSSTDPSQELLFMTQGSTIVINPDKAAQYSDEELTFKYAHVLLHCALKHPIRRQSRDHHLWNQASNIVVNNILDELPSLSTVPLDEKIHKKYKNKSVEEVYALLHQEQSSSEYEQSDDDILEVEPSQISDDLMVQALSHAQRSQSQSSSLYAEIHEIKHSDIDIYDIIKEYLTTSFFHRVYSYSRPNKRYRDIYLPSALYAKEALHVTIALDSSASIEEEEYKHFLGTISELIESLFEYEITLLPFDDSVHTDLILNTTNFDDRHAQDIRIPKTNGGTNFINVLAYINENEIKSDVLLVLSDGVFELYSTPPVPTVFILTDKEKLDCMETYGKTLWYRI